MSSAAKPTVGFIGVGATVGEALATGKPVYALCEGTPAGKLGRFQRAQVAAGRLRLLGPEPLEWSYAPLRELQRIVPLVRARL